ncbi:MAG: hypothetical protein WC374_11755, partial [Phycisphaerae bacterium]
DAQGDFARTSGSWANQLRLASLNMDTLSASLGAKLTPALLNVLQTFNQVAQESGGDLDVFLQNFDKVIEAGMKAADEILPIITGIAQQILNGLVKMLPKLLDMGADIVLNLAQGIIDNMPKIAEALGQIIGKIASMIPGLIWEVFKSIPIIVTKFIEGLFGIHDPLNDIKDDFDAIKKSVDSARDSLDKCNDETEAAARVNSNYADKLFDLADKENKTAEEKQQILNLVESLNKSMPELNLLYDEQTGKLNMTNGELRNMIENQKELARIEGLRAYLSKVSTALVEQEQKIKEYIQLTKDQYGADLTGFTSMDDLWANIDNGDKWAPWYAYADYEAMIAEQSKLNAEFNDLNEQLLDDQTTYSKRTGQAINNTMRDITQRQKDENETYLKNLQDWNTKVEDAQQQHEDTMGSIYDYGLKKQKITLWQAAKNIAKQVNDMIAYKKNLKTLQGMAEDGTISKEVYDQLAGEGTKAAGLIAALTKDPNSKAAQALLGSLQDKANLNKQMAIETVGARPVDPYVLQHASTNYRPYKSTGLNNFMDQTAIQPNVAAAMQAAGVYPGGAPGTAKEQVIKIDFEAIAGAVRKRLPPIVIDFINKSVLSVDGAVLASIVAEAQKTANLATGESE